MIALGLLVLGILTGVNAEYHWFAQPNPAAITLLTGAIIVIVIERNKK